MDVWSGKAAPVYDLPRIFGGPAHVGSSARKLVFEGYSGVFGYKLWDSKHMKIVLRRNVTFIETLDMKSPCSRQVESSQTSVISRQVEIDASPRSPGSSALGKIPVDVTQQGSQDTSEDVGRGWNQGHGQVQDSNGTQAMGLVCRKTMREASSHQMGVLVRDASGLVYGSRLFHLPYTRFSRLLRSS